jgi:23S rRNA (pseudouridine1915-N3)-methyltransferase
MQIQIIQIGKTKNDFLKAGIAEYTKRLNPFCKIEFITVKEIQNKSVPEIIEEEGKELLKKIPENAYAIILSEDGKEFTSREFARQFERIQSTHSRLVFVIGGPFGLSQKIKQRADLLLAFSKFTFTHEMIRMILLEQLYRAQTIIKNKNYHY